MVACCSAALVSVDVDDACQLDVGVSMVTGGGGDSVLLGGDIPEFGAELPELRLKP